MVALNTLYRLLWCCQRQLPRSLSRSLYKRLLRRGIAPDHAFAADFYGVRYEGTLSNNIDFNIYYYGAFEKHVLHFLGDTLQAMAPKNDGVFIDIGANVGQHSLYMQRFADKVIAFEPWEPVRARFEHHIAVNGITNIEVQPLGVSNSNSRLPFFAPSGSNAGVGSFDASSVEKGNLPAGELELVRGDDFFAARPELKIDLIKIDVEGFEKFALEGLRETLARNRPVVICELTYDTPVSFQSLEELQGAFPENYRLLTFDTRKPDGSKARRREARTRHSGAYRLVPYGRMLTSGQDDIIACPVERLEQLPLSHPGVARR